MHRTKVVAFVALALITLAGATPIRGAANGTIVIDVVCNTKVTPAVLADLGKFGTVVDVIDEINAVTLHAKGSALASVRSLPYVKDAGVDDGATGSPVDTVVYTDFAGGGDAWNLDVVNVTDPTSSRTVAEDGSGVYVAILDTGLQDSWRTYFPQERIAEQYGTTFQGASARSNAEPPNSWEHDQNGHGTHVTSTVLGYSLFGTPINGVAPNATVIPVKVLNNSGFGFWYVIARGIVYATNLKTGPLENAPLIISMSISGLRGSPILKAALDYAVARGVIVVVAAGNYGLRGMGYPGAYDEVISVAALGWKGQWQAGEDANVNNWWQDDVSDPTNVSDLFVANFSSRANPGQDLDVAAPGHYVLGSVQFDSGNLRPQYQFWSGTSMATPHVAGIVALMLQKNPALTAAEAEAILENAAIALAPAGCQAVPSPYGLEQHCWGSGYDLNGQNAYGHGVITADAALDGTPVPPSAPAKSKK